MVNVKNVNVPKVALLSPACVRVIISLVFLSIVDDKLSKIKDINGIINKISIALNDIPSI